MMLTTAEIAKIATDAANKTLPNGVLVRVFAEPTVSSVGEDAWRIIIVLAPNSVDRIDGNAVVNTLVRVQQDVEAAGEYRLPIVEYATEAELADAGD